MIRARYFVSAAAAALAVTTCVGYAAASGGKAANPIESTVAPAPAIDALAMLEKSAYEAWKSRDAKFWDPFLSDVFFGYGPAGKLDKASAAKQYTGADCQIKSYALSDEQIKPLGKDVALVTHKTVVDGTCGGHKIPAASWAASVYIRDGARWKGAFHAEAAIVDPKSAPPNPVGERKAAKVDEAETASKDAGTLAMLVREKAVWEAWRMHDANKLGGLTAGDISFINIFGTYLASKADALKDWSGTGCDVKSVSLTNAVGTMLSPTVGILTFSGSADGTCYGQKVGPIWGTSVYVRDGHTWKWTFGINLPASPGV